MRPRANSWAAVKSALRRVGKHSGLGAIMTLGEAPTRPSVSVISSGCVGLDMALGVGGFARGRIIEIFGPESGGKTTLALQAIAQAQQEQGVCVFIDAEHALDTAYARNLGVQAEQLLIAQPDCGEQALEICETLVQSGCIDLLVLDSVAALVPRAEMEGALGATHEGLQARLVSQAMRKLTGIAYRSGCALLLLNQLRQKMGATVDHSEVTAGGDALKFYASVRLEVRRVGGLQDGRARIGQRTRIRVVKNKLGPPCRAVEVDILYGRGVWVAADLVDCAVALGVLERSGAWLSWHGKPLAQGRSLTVQRLEGEPDLALRLHEAVWRRNVRLAASAPMS